MIELSITNRNVDLVDEGYDMAIRLGELADSGLAARRLDDAQVCLVASPDYLRRAGTPLTLDQLPGTLACPSSCRAPGGKRRGCCEWTGRIWTGLRRRACK
jgi:DNA-binding transcriptional LysR family regulator